MKTPTIEEQARAFRLMEAIEEIPLGSNAGLIQYTAMNLTDEQVENFITVVKAFEKSKYQYIGEKIPF